MFSTVLKNSILFVLIILILHFLINNILVEKKIVMKEEEVKNVVEGKEGKEGKEEKEDIEDIDIDYPRPERNTENTKKQELYDYVFDKNATKDLDTYYNVDNDIDANNKTDTEVKCADDSNNFCNTTKPTHDELKAHYGNFNFNKLQCSNNLDKEKEVNVVNNYDDEKPMNGGKSKDCEILAYDLSDNIYENI